MSSTETPVHKPVLLKEVLEIFESIGNNKIIVDCTLGLGGHSRELLKMGHRIIGIDRDSDAIRIAKENLKEFKNVTYVNDNYVNIRKILDRLNIEHADGILVDLGVSTYQLEDDERGFGFEGNLDMRMDKSQELNAEVVVNDYQESRISKMLFDYGERIFARKIARNIAIFRKSKRITKCEELLEIIKRSMPPRYRFSREHHWATPTFRAIRMEVNKDIENLENFMENFMGCLGKDGIITIISFHSIEDRIVKHKFKELAMKNNIKAMTKKPIVASEEEIRLNPKEKRAKLRAARRI